MDAMSPARIDWSVAGRSLDRESGDQYLVSPLSDGVLVAVVDGLGHGPEAAVAAKNAVGLIAEHAALPLPTLVRRCHDGLRSTRGVVLSLAAFDAAGMVWLGVGNVDGVLLRRAPRPTVPERLLVRGGVVGRHLPAVEPSHLRLAPGDVLIFTTDGVDGGFAEDLARRPREHATADRILAQYGKANDDALVVVARYLGAEA
jgi:negative regulator of sigma-B (phosphoserine phosphatase)